MKHLKKKFYYAGSKGSKPPPPKPPTLKPPRVGGYKIGASYQFSENVDLICHGPIDGLCNRFGSRLDNSQLLQGIYLNGVPIEQSVSTEKIRLNTSEFEGDNTEIDIVARLREIALVTKLNYRNPEGQQAHQTQMSVVVNRTGKYNTPSYNTYTWNKNPLSIANLSFSNSKPISYASDLRLLNIFKGTTESIQHQGHHIYGDQRWSEPVANGGQYQWPKYGNSAFLYHTGPYRAIINDTVKNTGIILEYSPGWAYTEQQLFRTWANIYQEGSCPAFGYDASTCTNVYQEGGANVTQNSVCRKGLNQLIEIANNKEVNKFEWAYLQKKLNAYGLGDSAGNIDSASFINQIKEKFGRAGAFEIKHTGANTKGDLVKPYVAFKYKWDYVLNGYTSANEYEFTSELTGEALERELDFILENYEGSYNWYARDQNTCNMLIPTLDKDTGKWNGRVKGFYLNFIATEVKTKAGTIFQEKINNNTLMRLDGTVKAFGMLNSEIQFYEKVTSLGIFKMPKASNAGLTKYNFLNVLAEYRNGDVPDKQKPLSFFKNIYLDRNIQKRLIGPFNVDGNRRMQALRNFNKDGIWRDSNGYPRQRSLIVSEENSYDNDENANPPRVGIPAPNTIPKMAINPDTGVEDFLLALEEGSSDKRPSTVENVGFRSFNFSDWNSFKQDYNEKAQPVTHVIYNPNVESCYITLNIEGLWDTLHHDESTTQSKIIGSKLPAIVNFRVEVGYIAPQDSTDRGQFKKVYDRFFRVLSLIEGGAAVDIGNPDNANNASQLSYVKELYKDTTGEESDYEGGKLVPFELPSPNIENGEYGFEQIFRERYIRVTKLSTESNSTLIQKAANLAKVTEIVPRTLNYPYSALVGVKVDSRSFGEIPKRSYDARLRLVKIPSNYTPLNDGGTDKRFWNNATDLIAAGKTEETRIYDGDWDGTFKIGWTDNPAWILYDMLTDPMIGLGDLIEPEQINKWQLYKIGRFCDAVDVNGYFVGVSDNIVQQGAEKGGRQPRYSCNTLFSRPIKIFDAINLVASNFRGLLYFSDSVVSFADDRIKEPIMTFTNDNVVEGVFNYSSALKDEQYNAVEVAYNDAEDNYEAKIEYLENENDIRERGLIKTRIDGFGITSRAQARRYGEHLLYQAVQENQRVSFSTGLEGMLVRPGDLIIIEDELKSLTSNYGKILGVDKDNQTIRISDVYDDNNFEGYITIYVPTGSQQVSDIQDLLLLDRARHDFFTLFDAPTAFGNKHLTGYYAFDSYQDGFRQQKEEGLDANGVKDEYAFYTGEEAGVKHFLWYSTQYTGWVFSTGQAFTHNTTYDKYISATSGETNGIWESRFDNFDNAALNYQWYRFTTVGDGRDAAEQFDLSDSWLDLRETKGAIVDDDIKINETKQIQNIKIASGVAAGEDSIGYTLYVDQNDESSIYTPLIPKGSIYRFKTKNTQDKVYKVMTINEDDTHSYEVVASEYKSGKFREIEETNYRDEPVYIDPYSEDYQVDGSKYFTLPEPGNPTFTARNITVLGGTSTVTIESTWRKVANATGYRLGIRPAFELEYTYFDTADTSFNFEGIAINGQYRLSIQSLGAVFDNDDFYTHYLDSSIYYAVVDVSSLEEATVIEGAVIESISLN